MAGRRMADKWGRACKPAHAGPPLRQIRMELFMRALVLLALLLLAPIWTTPAVADQIFATSKITAVTIYPQGAQITRDVSFTAPAGAHDLLITDLPAETAPDLIRLASDSASLGAFSLRTDRLPPRDDVVSPEMAAAKTAVEAAEATVRTAQGVIDAINARVEAADAQAGYLRGVKSEGDTATADGLKGIAAMIGAEVLAARQAALLAQTALPAAVKAYDDAQKVLTKAQDAQAALLQGDDSYVALAVAVNLAAAGETRLTVTHFVYEASWQPVYDVMLVRNAPASLTLNRGVLVSQYSGEDWAGVALTLSTARPSEQSSPSDLWPELRQIYDPEALAKSDDRARLAGTSDAMPEMMAEPVMEMAPAPVTTAMTSFQGDTVIYSYPTAVNIASGVENLRLALDALPLTPKIYAQAVPRFDRTAFLMASFVNDTGEIILPGPASLFSDGTLKGGTQLEGIAAGDKAELAFGAIDGLRLTRDMPTRAQGDRGILTTSTQIEETAVLKLENLTAEVWPVRLLDLIPYSEQEDLEITYTADPAPTESDVKGQRGILAWEFDMAAGETRTVTLNQLISWPEGQALQ